ncbi:MAG TPA: class I SAM-dependent methyltransferase [Fibrobacteria bacterium]|nr:class I SAM-dependent methyltransferase [Fibrobacteria bacterium]
MKPPDPAAFEAFRARVEREYMRDFGVRDPAQVERVAEAWFSPDARHDHRFAELRRRLPNARDILDLASGMGTATLRALELGYDALGVEPDAGKLALTRARIDAGALPPSWKGRFHRAVGEKLPFKDHSFDCVLSYQTLEHVADPAEVIAEMLRVTRPGGALHLRCPDYRGTFEGHYLLPWLPLMPRPLARLWLRLMGRPARGLEGIVYVTGPGLKREVRRQAAHLGIPVRITDTGRERFGERLRARGLPGWRGPSPVWRALDYARRLFRTEIEVDLWVDVGAV